jgi:hypothetical protein
MRERRKLQRRIKRLKEQLEAERPKGLLQRIFRNATLDNTPSTHSGQ